MCSKAEEYRDKARCNVHELVMNLIGITNPNVDGGEDWNKDFIERIHDCVGMARKIKEKLG